MHLSELKDSSDTTLVAGYLKNRLETLKSGGHYEYHQKQFKNYLLKKISETEALRQLSVLAETIYQVNQPQVHVFKIVKQ